MYDVAVIGAGVVGALAALEFTKYDLKVLVLDKALEPGNGTTKANSAIIHAGYNEKPGTLKARMNAASNPRFEELCESLDVPFEQNGSLVLAFDGAERRAIEALYGQGLKNKIPAMELLDRESLLRLEPRVNPDALGALWARTAAIIGPWELAQAAVESAVGNGAEALFGFSVDGLEKTGGGWRLFSGRRFVDAAVVVDCAGIHADTVLGLAFDPFFSIRARRGEYHVLDKSEGTLVKRTLFRAPSETTKGIVVVPTVHGNVLIGPNAEDIPDREGLETTAGGLSEVLSKAAESVPAVDGRKAIAQFAGLRAKTGGGDFIVSYAPGSDDFLLAAGIDSPGLSSAPAIAERLADLYFERHAETGLRPDFEPGRRRVPRFELLGKADRRIFAERNPSAGRIVCRCESVTEYEVVDAIHRWAGARTVDGIKRRCRPGSGRCQGGFCLPRVVEILSRELGLPPEGILKNGPGSALVLKGGRRHEIL